MKPCLRCYIPSSEATFTFSVSARERTSMDGSPDTLLFGLFSDCGERLDGRLKRVYCEAQQGFHGEGPNLCVSNSKQLSESAYGFYGRVTS
jgi:hypothetical protein